jgi:hypothetical protein
VTCPHCGQSADFKGYRPRTPHSLLGPLTFCRAYYHCGRCGQGLCPFDQDAGLSGRNLTPACEEAVALAGTLGDSFEEAAEQILPRLAGLRLGESTTQRTTEDAGRRLGERRQAGDTFGPEAPWLWHTDAQGRRVAYVGIDATGVHQQGPGGAAAPDRMPYVALVYNPPPAKAEATPAETKAGGTVARPRMQARYLAGLYALGELGRQLRRQAAQVGMEQAEVWIGMTDGGSGLEEFVVDNFGRPDVVLILDFWHAAEDLGELARLWHAKDEEAARQQAQGWCHTLKHQGGQALLDELRALAVPRRSDVKEKYTEVIRYIGNNVHRTDYPYYLSQGWQIGSGPVESACKTVVGARLKLAGIRWGEPGTDAVCQLRALFKSTDGQWDAFWQPSPN